MELSRVLLAVVAFSPTDRILGNADDLISQKLERLARQAQEPREPCLR